MEMSIERVLSQITASGEVQGLLCRIDSTGNSAREDFSRCDANNIFADRLAVLPCRNGEDGIAIPMSMNRADGAAHAGMRHSRDTRDLGTTERGVSRDHRNRGVAR